MMSEKEQRLKHKQSLMEKQVDRRDQNLQQYSQQKNQIIEQHQNVSQSNRQTSQQQMNQRNDNIM